LGEFGTSVALSADAGTALIGAPGDNGGAGAVWPYLFLQVSIPPSLSFGSQTTGQPGPVLWLSVQNTGQAPLSFSGEAQIAGADPGDFAVPSGDDLCASTTLDPGQTCAVGVQFTAAESGERWATLSLATSNANFEIPWVSLTGTGLAASSGPPANNGNSDNTATNGAEVPPGPGGPPGPTGPGTQWTGSPPGSAAKVELVTCRQIKGKQRCTAKLVPATVSFTSAGALARATLSSRGKVYATGLARRVDGRLSLKLTALHTLQAGSYTLALTSGTGKHERTRRQSLALS
jgi:hypothetical protein